MTLVTKEGKDYTYADYLTWPEGERWELIEGIAYAKEGGSQAMAPAPSRRHQEVSVQLTRVIANFLQDKPCKVYHAPFDVRLEKTKSNRQLRTVVQPDISVFCDASKLDEKGGTGPPDWIVEIVSPGSPALDYVKKLNLYEKHQVREYWIVHPFDETVMVFALGENSLYGRPATYAGDARIPVGIFQGELVIDLAAVFAT